MRDQLSEGDAQEGPKLQGVFPRRIPPAPTWRRLELEVLGDLDEALGLTLWLAIRRVQDWVESSPEERAHVCTDAAESEPVDPERPRRRAESAERLAFALTTAPEATSPLGVFSALRSTPHLLDPATVAEACDQMSEWAEARAMYETALQFAEAAAALEPNSPKRANLAGRACRLAGLWSRADIWYQRGLGMARHPRNRIEGFRGHLGAGAVAYLQGRLREARRHFRAGAWMARDMGRMPLAARAQHDLLLLGIAFRDYEKAVRCARRALEWYPTHHPRIPYLAHDFAWLLTRLRQDAPALQLLDRTFVPIEAEHERLLVWGTVARAAAGDANVDRFQIARERVVELSGLYPHHYAAHSLYEVAEGARLLALWPLAEKFAVAAVETARKHGAADTEADAAQLLSDIADRVPAPPVEGLPSATAQEVGVLIRLYSQRLTRWRRRPPREAPPPRSDP